MLKVAVIGLGGNGTHKLRVPATECPVPDAYETTRLCFAAEHSAAIGKPVQMSSFS